MQPKNGLCVSLFRLLIQCRLHISLYIQPWYKYKRISQYKHTHILTLSMSEQSNAIGYACLRWPNTHTKLWNEESTFFFAPIYQKEWKREHYTKIRIFFILVRCDFFSPLLHIQMSIGAFSMCASCVFLFYKFSTLHIIFAKHSNSHTITY